MKKTKNADVAPMSASLKILTAEFSSSESGNNLFFATMMSDKIRFMNEEISGGFFWFLISAHFLNFTADISHFFFHDVI